MRFVALIVTLLAMGATGFFTYRFYGNYQTFKEDPQKFEFMIAFAKEMGQTSMTMADYQMQFAGLPYLAGGLAAALVACVLILMRQGLLAAVLLIAAGAAPVIVAPFLVIFSSPFFLAALFAIFVRRRKAA
jgi:hypothetical protein